MFDLLPLMILIMVISVFVLPASILVLARCGYFEPIHFVLFGRQWSFKRRDARVVGFSNATWETFPIRQYASAGVVTVALTISAANISINPIGGVSGTRSTATAVTRD